MEDGVFRHEQLWCILNTEVEIVTSLQVRSNEQEGSGNIHDEKKLEVETAIHLLEILPRPMSLLVYFGCVSSEATGVKYY